MGFDRRHWERLSVPAKILVTPDAGEAFEARVRDISGGGAFVLSDRRLSFRQRCEITFFPGGGEVELKVHAEVVHAGESGAGLEFAGIPEEARAQLAVWIGKLASGPPPDPRPAAPAKPARPGSSIGRMKRRLPAARRISAKSAPAPAAAPKAEAQPAAEARAPAKVEPPAKVEVLAPAKHETAAKVDAAVDAKPSSQGGRRERDQPRKPAPSAPNGSDSSGPRILVVQDNEELARLLLGILNKVGADAVGAYDARAALGMLETEKFHAVIVDWLPLDLPAEKLVQLLRERSPKVPILVVTALSQNAAFTARARALGATEFLRKPFQLAEMLQILELMMN